MTEMEELKQNAEQAKVKQTLDGISAYMDQLVEECDIALKKSLRADSLLMLTFAGYFAVLTIAVFADLDPMIRRLHTELMFMVELVALFRQFYFTKVWREKEGEWTGFCNTLRILGMLPPRGEKGIKNKKKLWSEGIAMVKRWAEEKAAELKKGFAPA